MKPVEITLDNYEAFLLDKAAGTINPQANQALTAFLLQHPHLDVDLDGLMFATLPTDDITPEYPNKANLKVSAFDYTHFDELAIKQLEGIATPTEIKELNAMLANNPALINQYNAFKLTKLTPNTSLVYGNKAALKQSAAIYAWARPLAVAASLALLLGGAYLMGLLSTQQTNTPTMAANGIVKGILPKVNPPAPNKLVAPATSNTLVYIVKQPVPQLTAGNDTATTPVQPFIAAVAQPITIQALTALAQPSSEFSPMAIGAITPGTPAPMPTQQGFNLWAWAKEKINIDAVKNTEVGERIELMASRGPSLDDVNYGLQRISNNKLGVTRNVDDNTVVTTYRVGRYNYIRKRTVDLAE